MAKTKMSAVASAPVRKREVMLVTPSQAKAWLERNKSNRRIRERFVYYLANEILQGNWQVTHQGIAFNTEGDLLDGQHRLCAIVKANVAVEIEVTTGVDRATVIGYAVDNGEKRTQADIRGISCEMAAMLNGLLKVVYFKSRKFSTGELDVVVEVLGDSIDTFLSMCHRKRGGVSSNSYRVPVFIHWMLQGASVLDQYNAFVSLKNEEMCPRVEAYLKQMTRDSKYGQGDWLQVMTKVWSVFDPTKQSVERLVIAPIPTVIKEMQTALDLLGLVPAIKKHLGPHSLTVPH